MIDFSTVKSIAIPEGNVVQIEAGGKVLWKSGPLPAAYQQVEWIQNSEPSSTSSGAYIDLGFAFDTAAVIHCNWITASSSGQPFGAAENSGILRCMISEGSTYTVYGSNGSKYLAYTVSKSGIELEDYLVYTLKKGTIKVENLTTGTASSTGTTQTAYTMTRNLYLFAQNYNTAARFNGLYKVKSFQYYDKTDTLICDLIPCYRKADGVIGMYDVVRKIFLTNAGSGSFTIPGGGYLKARIITRWAARHPFERSAATTFGKAVAA